MGKKSNQVKVVKTVIVSWEAIMNSNTEQTYVNNVTDSKLHAIIFFAKKSFLEFLKYIETTIAKVNHVKVNLSPIYDLQMSLICKS